MQQEKASGSREGLFSLGLSLLISAAAELKHALEHLGTCVCARFELDPLVTYHHFPLEIV